MVNPYVPFLRVMADVQTFEYLNLVGDENDIGSEYFKWPGSRVSTSSFNRNAIGLAVSYASAHLFVDAWYQSPGARGGGALECAPAVRSSALYWTIDFRSSIKVAIFITRPFRFQNNAHYTTFL